eukprot:jgi/Botrbrau1/13721/Bobra.0356s0002.1
MNADQDSDAEFSDAVYIDDDAVVLDVEDTGVEESPEGSDMEDDEALDPSLYTFDKHTDAVYSVAWHPLQSDIAASGGGDEMAYIWQVGGEGQASPLVGHTETVTAVGFNRGGNYLATASLDGTVWVWETGEGRCKWALEGPQEGLNWLCWHPSGNVLVAGSEDFSCWMWNADTKACMQVFSGHTGAVDCGMFTPDGKMLVTGGGDGDASLRAWNPKTGDTISTARGAGFHQTGLTCMDITADSTACISGSADGSIFLTQLTTGKVLASMSGHTDSVEAIRVCKHIPVIASAGIDGKLILWDAARHVVRGTCEHPEAVVALVIHETQPWAVTACLDGIVRVWDIRTGQLLRSTRGHGQGIQDVVLNPAGNKVLTASDDHTCKVFDLLE